MYITETMPSLPFELQCPNVIGHRHINFDPLNSVVDELSIYLKCKTLEHVRVSVKVSECREREGER